MTYALNMLLINSELTCVEEEMLSFWRVGSCALGDKEEGSRVGAVHQASADKKLGPGITKKHRSSHKLHKERGERLLARGSSDKERTSGRKVCPPPRLLEQFSLCSTYWSQTHSHPPTLASTVRLQL